MVDKIEPEDTELMNDVIHQLVDGFNELVTEFNNLKDRFETTLEVNNMWDGS